MPRFFAFYILVFILTCTSCASLDKLFVTEDPDSAFDNKEYAVAAALYTEEYDQIDNLIDQAKLAFKIGECHRLANNTNQAESWYEKSLQYYSEPEVFYKYGLMQKSNEKYEQAVRTFKEYARSNPLDRANATRQIRSCQTALEWKAEPTDFEIFNLSEINSPASDYGPILLGDQLVFTSARSSATGEGLYGWTGEKHSDIFVADKVGESGYGHVRAFSELLNTPYNEGALSFNREMDEVYFTRCGSPKDESKKDEQESDDFCGIYFASLDEVSGEWNEPELLDLFESDSINVGHPSISPDGKYLFLSADAPGGLGDKDIYVSEKKLLGWSYPKNLGPAVNTSSYEGFPYMHVDGKLYFASSGHLGMGGLDVFSSEIDGNRWGKVENLKYPINSAGDDLGIIFQTSIAPELVDSIESIGFVASSRMGGQGNDDIYKFVLNYPVEEPEPEPEPEVVEVIEPEPIILLVGTVSGKQYEDANDPKSSYLGNERLPDAVVEVLGLNAESTFVERIIANGQGSFELVIEPNSELKVSGSKVEFFSASKNVNTFEPSAKDTTIINVDLVLDRIFKEREIVLDNIYYDLASAEIREDAKPVLDKLALLLQDNPNIQIELGAHTDSRGQDRYNQELSAQRAQSVVNYVAKRGVAPQRMRSRGYGESALVNDCADGVNCSEEEHQVNRRTTFKVISDSFRSR